MLPTFHFSDMVLRGSRKLAVYYKGQATFFFQTDSGEWEII